MQLSSYICTREVAKHESSVRASIEAFCLRMLRRKYFDVSNRCYALALRVRKMAIAAAFVSAMEVVFFFSH